MDSLSKSEAQILINIVTEWLDRNPVKIFNLGQGDELQSALRKLSMLTSEHVVSASASADITV